MSRESKFRFKQFEVENSISGMKVGTDSVLLGAWCSSPSGATVIDAGAGCGLLALMMAQRGATNIVGVEIDDGAADEAASNVAASPWADRVRIIRGDYLDPTLDLPSADIIISNPPYFTNGAIAPDMARATARHTLTLDVTSLIRRSASLLTPEGRIALVTPKESSDAVISAAAFAGLTPLRIADVHTRAERPATRMLWELGRTLSATPRRETLTIGSDEYRSLVTPFYLNM